MENERKNHENSNYDLKSDAVEKLVKADAGETPQFTQEELNRYRSKGRFHIPEAVKILFLKAWFPGAVCYFFFWGLGTYVGSLIDMLFILSVGLGLVTDLLTNNVIRYFEKTNGANNKWLLFTKKGMASFFFHLVYGFAITLCVYYTYNLINLAAAGITGQTDAVFLGVEPVLFGVFCMGYDMLFIAIKRTFGNIIRDAKNAARGA